MNRGRGLKGEEKGTKTKRKRDQVGAEGTGNRRKGN